jgi:probable rRNA maturation factor
MRSRLRRLPVAIASDQEGADVIVEVVNDSSVDVSLDHLREQGQWLITALGLHDDCELSIALVDDERMAELHVEYMNEPGATDVLSFPMDDVRVAEPGEEPVAGILGDVILCPQVAAAQADTAGHGLDAELELLLTHGVLHLLGHDHEEPDEHALMFGIQDDLLTGWRNR